jgi:hypothetical protein
MVNPFKFFSTSDLNLLVEYVSEAHANWEDFTTDEDCEPSEALQADVSRLGELVELAKQEQKRRNRNA